MFPRVFNWHSDVETPATHSGFAFHLHCQFALEHQLHGVLQKIFHAHLHGYWQNKVCLFLNQHERIDIEMASIILLNKYITIGSFELQIKSIGIIVNHFKCHQAGVACDLANLKIAQIFVDRANRFFACKKQSNTHQYVKAMLGHKTEAAK